ncbi:MAG: cyclic nucleotide-binding domain-containing protein [Pseudomonadota bacterium]
MNRNSPVILERKFFPKDGIILQEGEAGNSAYLIQSGAVRVFTEHEGKEITLAKLGVGQIFGEMALIFDDLRAASVRASEDCNLIVITRQSFQDKLASSDPTIKAIVQMLTQRIVSSNNTLINKRSSADDLMETCQIIYQNMFSNMPKNRQRTFQNAVLPKLDSLLEAIRDFEDRYKGQEDSL